MIQHSKERASRFDTLAIDTDHQALSYCKADRNLHIGDGEALRNSPDHGLTFAEASRVEIGWELAKEVHDTALVILVAGLGGGTGSTILPIVAQIAQENNQLVIPIVTLPARFEGAERRKIAENALTEIGKVIGPVLHIDNNQLIRHGVALKQFFSISDAVIFQIIESLICPLIEPGPINLDLSDNIQAFKDLDTPWISVGIGQGPDAFVNAANYALSKPLNNMELDKPAKGHLHWTVPPEMELHDNHLCENDLLKEKFGCADITYSCTYDATLIDQVKLTIIATGIPKGEIIGIGDPEPSPVEENKLEENFYEILSLFNNKRSDPVPKPSGLTDDACEAPEGEDEKLLQIAMEMNQSYHDDAHRIALMEKIESEPVPFELRKIIFQDISSVHDLLL